MENISSFVFSSPLGISIASQHYKFVNTFILLVAGFAQTENDLFNDEKTF